ncbi:thiamine phosphate synthase [Glycomyces sp. NEAU-7082]|uniref:Thiamine-phosphate synthase n=1 Tax=Glycomyces albidus TaxID=2656774 RepID=A0A6L5G5Q0_9ACTN|nr:thiamine phosphate synthase [Glycomyces albidus]MQM24974.1 thiamine phosphate synthase [Glycomyces albidus]
MRAIRLPRLHVITDTRAPIAPQAAGPHPDGPRTGSEPVAPQGDPLNIVAAALAAGARLVQVRPEDHYSDRAAFDFAASVAALCEAHGAVCLVNDRVHIAQAVGADGVHLGAEDLPVDAARRILPADAIIGGTCRDPESARAARRAGATYLGVGPVWGTTTKAGLPQPIGLDGLAAVCEAVDLPVIAIGGITAERAALCREAGAHGVAVVGAIAGAPDPAAATADLLAAVGETPGAPETSAASHAALRETSTRARLDVNAVVAHGRVSERSADGRRGGREVPEPSKTGPGPRPPMVDTAAPAPERSADGSRAPGEPSRAVPEADVAPGDAADTAPGRSAGGLRGVGEV